MIGFNFSPACIAETYDRERECANLARIVDSLGKCTSSVHINGVTVNAKFRSASMDAELTDDGNMILEIVFDNGTSVDIEIETSDRIELDSMEGILFIRIYA